MCAHPLPTPPLATPNLKLVRKDHGKPTPFEITKFNHLLGLEIHKNVKLCVLFVHKSVIKS